MTLTRQFLLDRGFCCNLGCVNCPYQETPMDVYKPGSDIHLGPEKDIPGRINQVIIRPDLNVIYKCCWWNGGTRIEEFLYAEEFTIDKPEKIKIGYK